MNGYYFDYPFCRVTDMNIQVPPNLNRSIFGKFLDAGINDWGGISPVTIDHVNPEFPWPSIETVEKNCADVGFELRARFPVYPEFLSYVNSDLKSKIMEMADFDGLVKGEYLK